MTDNLPIPKKPHEILVQAVQSAGDKIAAWNGGGSKYADFLPGTLAITEKPPRAFATALLLTVSVFTCVMILWMALAHVDQVVTGTGKARPAEKVQIINHPTGGKITELLVHNGDKVEAGQLLARLDPDVVAEEVKKLTLQVKTLTADVARLDAAAQDMNAPVFPEDLVRDYPDLVATQTALFMARKNALAEKKAAAAQEVESRKAEIAQFDSRIKNASKSLELVQKQASATRELAEKGYYPELRVLSIERDVSSQKGELDQARTGRDSSRAGLAQAEAQLRQMESAGKNEILTELNDKRTERDKLVHQLEQIITQRTNLELRAPVSGFVDSLKVSNAGQSVTQGEPIMHIVPLEDAFMIDTRVSNRDIGHIQTGQKARLKFHAFDYQRFGDITGTVLAVSNDATVDERTGEAYFIVQIKPEKSYLGTTPNPRFRIQSGMTADVDLETGRRSILSYLLDTILRGADDAFKES